MSPTDNAEDFELAMDALFAGLHSSHLAVRHGTIRDPWEPADTFRPSCGRCHRQAEPGSVVCECGSRLTL